MLWTHYRALVAALSRDRAPDDPELLAARRNLATARLADEIQRTIEKDPPPSDEQRAQLAAMLAPAGGRP